jgi:hypothetical protein
MSKTLLAQKPYVIHYRSDISMYGYSFHDPRTEGSHPLDRSMSFIHQKEGTMRMGMQTVHQLALFAMIITVLFTGGVLQPRAATAATYYTATTGSDSNPGTLGQPFRTVAKGISVLSAGDTLYLRGGTYAEAIGYPNPPLPSGTSFSNAVTIAGYSGEIATVRSINITGTPSRYIIFRDFHVDHGQTHAAISVSNFVENDGNGYGSNYIRFQNMDVTGWGDGGQGEGVELYSNHNEFINVVVHDSPQDVAYRHHCYYIESAYNLIDGGQTYNCSGYGIQIYNGYNSSAAHDNIIRNVRIYHNGGSSNPGGIVMSKGQNNLAYNNLIYNQIGSGHGIDISYEAHGSAAYNNTIYNNSGTGVFVDTSVSGAIIKNNIIYNNLTPIDDRGSGTLISKNLTTNPLFVKAEANDFHLQATSPAIDAGTSISAVTVDLQGTPRPQAAGYDIGAYEYPGLQVLPAPKNFKIISAAP